MRRNDNRLLCDSTVQCLASDQHLRPYWDTPGQTVHLSDSGDVIVVVVKGERRACVGCYLAARQMDRPRVNNIQGKGGQSGWNKLVF